MSKVFIFVLVFLSGPVLAVSPYYFDDKDRRFLKSLSLANVPNVDLASFGLRVDQNAAAKLGKKIFFDTRLSANGRISCASCHQPEMYFTDGLAQAVGMGIGTRNTPSVLLAKYSPWQTWDGHKDSMWSQALGPIESVVEHGFSRAELVKVIEAHYKDDYKTVFGPIDDQNKVFANVGKALMAYQFQLGIEYSRFDQFVEALANNDLKKARDVMAPEEVKGLRLFAGKANCISCHNGPLFTNFEFHNVGVPPRDEAAVDLGRYKGVKDIVDDEFTCLSQYSGLDEKDCLEMKFLKTSGPELVGAFKTPSLRNVAETAPYMHAGQFSSLEEVVQHYNKPKPPFFDRKQHPNRPHFDIFPLRLSEKEKEQLVAFLRTLTSPKPKEDPWWNI